MNSQTTAGKPKPQEASQKAVRLVAEEYKALRDEIMKRIELRYQIINLTLLSAGAIITAGLQPGVSSSVLFVFPILGTFLATAWVDNTLAVLRIAQYIRQEIEEPNQWSGWETYLHKKDPTPGYAFGGLGHLSTVGIFIGSQAITWALGLAKGTNSLAENLLLLGGVIALIWTLYLVGFRLRVQR